MSNLEKISVAFNICFVIALVFIAFFNEFNYSNIISNANKKQTLEKTTVILGENQLSSLYNMFFTFAGNSANHAIILTRPQFYSLIIYCLSKVSFDKYGPSSLLYKSWKMFNFSFDQYELKLTMQEYKSLKTELINHVNLFVQGLVTLDYNSVVVELDHDEPIYY